MKALIAIATVLCSLGASAKETPAQIAAKNMKANDTRTVITVVENKDGNPCLPAGKSSQVKLQVKQASYNGHHVIHKWQTVKTINVAKDGSIMEICLE